MESAAEQKGAPFLGVSRNDAIREVRRLSEAEAAVYYDAASRLRVYERELFPYASLLQNFNELLDALKHYAQPENSGLFNNLRSASSTALHLNRLIMNFLASFRAFLDHSETRFIRSFGRDSTEYRDLKSTMALHYDSSFSYPFLYKLRHYAQHCGLPMGNLEAFSTEDAPGSKKMAHSIRVSFVRDQLLEDFDDWGVVRARIAAKPEEWDITGDLEYVMTACTDIQGTIFKATLAAVADAARLVQALRSEVSDSDVLVFVGTIVPHGERAWQVSVNELPTHIAEMVLDELADRQYGRNDQGNGRSGPIVEGD